MTNNVLWIEDMCTVIVLCFLFQVTILNGMGVSGVIKPKVFSLFLTCFKLVILVCLSSMVVSQ